MFPTLYMKPTNNLTKKTTPFDAPHLPLQDSNIFTNKTDDNILLSINSVLITSELYHRVLLNKAKRMKLFDQCTNQRGL